MKVSLNVCMKNGFIFHLIADRITKKSSPLGEQVVFSSEGKVVANVLNSEIKKILIA